MFPSTSSTELSGTERTFLAFSWMSKTYFFPCTCSSQCCYSNKHLLTFNSAFGAGGFRSSSSWVLSFLASSCLQSTREIKAAADFLRCSYPYFTAGGTETFWIVAQPKELHRNVNASSKTQERVGIGARIKMMLVLYFLTKLPSECTTIEPNTRSSLLAFNFSLLISIAGQMERAPVHKTQSSIQLGWSSRKMLIIICNWRQISPTGVACCALKFHPWYHDFIKRS